MACIDLRGIPVSRYFRTGVYTDLSVDRPYVNPDGDTVVSWRYMFRDYGMDHEISKTFLVRPADSEAYLVKDVSEASPDESNVVDALLRYAGGWRRAKGRKECCDAIFDHYWSYNAQIDSYFLN
jgi:hypothetical protein